MFLCCHRIGECFTCHAQTCYFSLYFRIAKKRRVFKVETIGDCYVAVAGVPDPRKDHAVVMARFAADCASNLQDLLVNKLDPKLGSGTRDLKLRIGLHSGAVTAGVLRGDRSRFQLFGDTMNTASRMETTGIPGRIHVSEETADLLTAAGKHHWVSPRKDLVNVKGKGSNLQTFWVSLGAEKNASISNGSSDLTNIGHDDMFEEGEDSLKEKIERLINWNVEVFMNLLQKTVASRASRGVKTVAVKPMSPSMCTPTEELEEVIHFPQVSTHERPARVDLDPSVSEQLLHFVQTIASLYDNGLPFHNFEHASHVTMSMHHLLNRVHSSLNCFDPLTQLALHMAALVHDVGHTGVANLQLAKEKPELVQYYGQTGLAEQYSLDLAWNLLQNEDYRQLRQACYANEEEQKHFRQVLIRSVLATDIMDTKGQKQRDERWKNAFSECTSDVQDRDVKLTLILESLMQAADICPLMQHWSVYLKWNQRLFAEMKVAFKANRFPKDPSVFWVKGELGFFDNVVIPLATKLQDAGISKEYLLMATQNREEWKNRGEDVFEVSYR